VFHLVSHCQATRYSNEYSYKLEPRLSSDSEFSRCFKEDGKMVPAARSSRNEYNYKTARSSCSTCTCTC
jgi:hypothetical protein